MKDKKNKTGKTTPSPARPFLKQSKEEKVQVENEPPVLEFGLPDYYAPLIIPQQQCPTPLGIGKEARTTMTSADTDPDYWPILPPTK